jgi:3D (Asp-Asp-Asp) domain-containing protein
LVSTFKKSINKFIKILWFIVLKKEKMTNKYNMIINILFWVLVSVLIFLSVIVVFTQNDRIDSFLVRTETEIVVEKEPIYITEVKEIKKEIEWFYFVATGYSANDPLQGTNNITATGKEIKKGMVAVDPKIIPLGTQVEIKDIGLFIAEDTGGKIKGNRIDIYFETKEEAKNFGRQVIWVRMLGSNLQLVEALSNLK